MSIESKSRFETQNLLNNSSDSSNSRQQKQRIYPVTEGIQSTRTEIVYKRCFNHFLDHIQIHDLQVLLDFSPKIIKQMLVDHVLYLRDEKPGKKLSRTSIKVHLTAILHFFQINNDDFNLTTRNFRIHLPSDESAAIGEDRPYTPEEIGQVIRECDLRCKVMILLLCSSGTRMGALHSLQIGDLSKISFQNAILYKVQVYARTRYKYYTFCTPECAKAIDDYFEYRKRCGEELKDKSPLIREQFNRDNPFPVNAPRFVSEKGIEHIIDNVLKKSGVRKPRVIHLSHGFRKFFMTQCEQKGMKSINVKMLLGHDIGVSGHYYRPAENDILEDYMTHSADALTISDEHQLKRQVEKLESERITKGDLEELRKQWLTNLQREYAVVSLADWNALKEDMDRLKEVLYPPKQQHQQQRMNY
jgi:integrase